MRRAKAAAAAEGRSLTAFIAEAVSAKLSGQGTTPIKPKRVTFPTYDMGGTLPGVPPIDDNSALNDYLDAVDGPARL
jgi:hypothetical protein